MPKPVDFPESNLVMTAPKDLDNCDAMRVCQTTDVNGTPLFISRWGFSSEEIAQLVRTRHLWQWVYGTSLPPIALSPEDPFGRDEIEAEPVRGSLAGQVIQDFEGVKLFALDVNKSSHEVKSRDSGVFTGLTIRTKEGLTIRIDATESNGVPAFTIDFQEA